MEKVTHDWRRSHLNAIFKVSWSSFTANDRLSLVFKMNLLNNLLRHVRMHVKGDASIRTGRNNLTRTEKEEGHIWCQTKFKVQRSKYTWPSGYFRLLYHGLGLQRKESFHLHLFFLRNPSDLVSGNLNMKSMLFCLHERSSRRVWGRPSSRRPTIVLN